MRTLLVALLAAAPLFAGELTGRVAGPGGKPLKDAYVYVYTAQPKKGVGTICPECYVDCGKQVAVDAKGNFRIKKVDDKLRFNLLAVADGHEPAFSDYRDPGPGFDFELKPRDLSDAEHLVRGRVVDPKGNAVVGAAVRLHAVRQGKRVGFGRIPGVEWLSITNRDGEFALRVDDPTWLLDVRVEARNFGPRIARELLAGVPAQQVQVDVGATMTGRLVKDEKPVAGTALLIIQTDRRSENYLGSKEIATDAKGQFVMTGLGTEVEYQVLPRMASFAPLTAAPKVVKTGADRSSVDAGTLVAMPGFRVAGRVNGTIPAETRVTLSSGIDSQVFDLESDGRFVFTGVPAGKYSLSAAARDARGPLHRFEVKGDVEDVTLELK